MAKNQKAYFGLDWIVSLILCFFFGWILGIIVRVQRGNILMAVLNFFFGFIFWIVDFVSLILNKDIKWLV